MPLRILTSPKLSRLPRVVHAFSTRRGGASEHYGGKALNLGFTASDAREHVERNRRAFFKAAGAAGFELVRLKQIHSDVIHLIDRAPEKPLNGDAAITDRPGLLLSILTADCLPVLVADRRTGALGAFHAGWRGTARRIVQKGIGRMRMHFGSRPKDLQVAIGPGIHKCCYSVGEEVVQEFESQFPYAGELFSEVFDLDPVKLKYPLLFLTARAPGHSNLGPQIHLDLVEANRRQLLEAGVPAGNIWTNDLCTGCRTDLLFSHRAEAGYTGRMMAIIGRAAASRRKRSRPA